MTDKIIRMRSDEEPLVYIISFMIQDPCGLEAIMLARTIIEVFGDREDKHTCERMISDLKELGKKYPRIQPKPMTPRNGDV